MTVPTCLLPPREKLADRGASALSDRELLAVLIGSGCRQAPVEELSRRCLEALDAAPLPWKPDVLAGVRGIGPVKSAQLAAALEFCRRRLAPGRPRIRCAGDLWDQLRTYGDRRQEHFFCLSLNGAHEVLALRLVTLGLLNRTLIHPREVFADPLAERAAAVMVAHNHPSGRLEPSPEDRDITRRLYDSGRLLGIPVLDHLIFTDQGWFSFAEAGELPPGGALC